MFIWAPEPGSETKQLLLFASNPQGVGLGVVQRLDQQGGKPPIWRWAPLLKDIYRAASSIDFSTEDMAKLAGVRATLLLLTRFGLAPR